jgi:hypothetical protein
MDLCASWATNSLRAPQLKTRGSSFQEINLLLLNHDLVNIIDYRPLNFGSMPPRLAAMAGSSSNSGFAQGNDTNEREEAMEVELEQVDVDTLYLQPPAFTRKDKGKWQESGKTIVFALSPVRGEVASWVTAKVRLKTPSLVNISF